MASYRHLARTCVMQTIFEMEFRTGPFSCESEAKEIDPQDILASILNEFAPKLTEKEFAKKTLEGVVAYHKEILDTIAEFAPEWPIDKIARIDRAILEIGVYEIAFSEEVPPVVAINEAVEIAKHFGDNNSQKFINGVLSSVMKKHHEKL
ncbi:MAG: transcription antitermination factor NusB [Candidatus Peregrinibacteria bacterium]|nr:transcription antitermination factor NusB [Candidatus Peregrinibacteria bacterium]